MNLRDAYERYRKRIEAYGFVYRPYLHTTLLIAMYLGVIFFGFFFRMHPLPLFILLLSVTLVIPVILYLQYEYSFEESCFKEFTSYIQQVSAAFKMHPKIHTAMQEALPLVSGELHHCVSEALSKMNEGENYEDALACIEDKYSIYILENLHRLMVAVEVHGAKRFEEGIHLLQDDLDDLIEDMYLHQKELLAIQKKVYILCLLSILISVLSKNMLMDLYAFQKELIYQGVLLLFVFTLLCCIILSQVFLRHSWRIWGNDR